jgi:cation diffusion facilitator family transporter
MHDNTLNRLQHSHHFVVSNEEDERRTKFVVLLTFVTMVVEIVAGIWFDSISLLADGWHMATQVATFLTTLFACRYSRFHTNNDTFAFGAGKVGVLGGFASSVALGIVALLILIESGQRLLTPQTIHFNEAIVVAVFGLCINVFCAFLLRNHVHTSTIEVDEYGLENEYQEEDEFEYAHEQNNHKQSIKATYLHIIAETLTSVLAITALTSGKYYGWNSLDPIMGVVGALIIGRWVYVLIKETSPVLLDKSIALRYKAAIQETIEADADNRIADLHIWQVSPGHFAVILSVISHTPRPPEYYKSLLTQFNLHGSRNHLAHITVEVHPCSDESCFMITPVDKAKSSIRLHLR